MRLEYILLDQVDKCFELRFSVNGAEVNKIYILNKSYNLIKSTD